MFSSITRKVLLLKQVNILILLAFILTAGCQTKSLLRCVPSEKLAQNEFLYFGRSSINGPITKKQWSSFLKEFVTPKFPDGFTVWDARGQWRSSDDRIVLEESYVLNVVYIKNQQTKELIESIIDDYKTMFHQESVLRVRSLVCANI